MKHLHVENLTINISSAPPIMTGALLTSFAAALSEPGPAREPATANTKPVIGEYWQGQGGIYAGDFRGDDGQVYGLIVSDLGDAQDIGRAEWGGNGEHSLSDWDGLTNTGKLLDRCPAANLAADYTRDGQSDFYLPARRELQLAGANLQHLFSKESWYWSSTPYAEHYAWSVGFEYGLTLSRFRDYEFRVRPVRRFIY